MQDLSCPILSMNHDVPEIVGAHYPEADTSDFTTRYHCYGKTEPQDCASSLCINLWHPKVGQGLSGAGTYASLA